MAGVRWLLAVALAIASCGCASSPEPPARKERARRIVVLAPAAAEMLGALGALDRVVGIGDFVRDPLLSDRPVVGAFDAPNVERVLELGADLVLTAKSDAARAAHDRLSALGVEVLALDTSTYEGVFGSLAEVGRVLGREDDTAALARAMRAELEQIRTIAAGLPPRRVLFVVGRDPLYVAGPGSHVDEMIALVGGTNVIDDVASPYPRVSLESVLERAPEVIIDTGDNRPGTPRGRVAGAWARWEFLPAVRDGRVYSVDPALLVIPGLRLSEMTRLVGRLVHPEAFGEASATDLGPPEPAGGSHGARP